ncbi:MAG: response regulator [Clostridiaceae bacterium]
MDINYKKQTILVVDDSRLNLTYLSNLLINQYNVKTAANGEEALRIIFSENSPDLVLLDVVMPGMDGYEVCRRIKAEDSTKNIPVIFITGKQNEEDEIYGFKIGAVDYITKHLSPVIVNVRINTHMELIRYRNYLESISYLDGLTNIPNRRRFNEHSELLWNIAERERKVISVIMIDIDYFKAQR